jgi:uncharacterized protein
LKETAMRVAVTGASGLVGSALIPELQRAGHEPVRVVRGRTAEGEIGWDPGGGTIDTQALAGVNAVVHLAGENIASGRWTAARKTRIRDSRVQGTTLLAQALADVSPRPQTLVSASAIGFYGDRGENVCTESTPAGEGFLAEVCQQWEQAAQPAREAGIRVVHPRIGVVLSKNGGALEKMLLPFKLGLGGKVGSGRQYWSWIGLYDLVGIIVHALEHTELSGPVNAVAPEPVTNLEFTKTLGSVLHRPTIFPLPAFAARLALGQMADQLLLASTRVVPQRLQGSGYVYHQADLESALQAALADSHSAG